MSTAYKSSSLTQSELTKSHEGSLETVMERGCLPGAVDLWWGMRLVHGKLSQAGRMQRAKPPTPPSFQRPAQLLNHLEVREQEPVLMQDNLLGWRIMYCQFREQMGGFQHSKWKINNPSIVWYYKEYRQGNCLVVQWLGFPAYTAKARVQFQVKELSSINPEVWQKKKLSWRVLVPLNFLILSGWLHSLFLKIVNIICFIGFEGISPTLAQGMRSGRTWDILVNISHIIGNETKTYRNYINSSKVTYPKTCRARRHAQV